MVSKRWTWLAALGLLFAGLTNAHSHIHYCFDGQEPPAAVHLTDSTDHHHELPGHHDDGADHGAEHHDGAEHDGAEHEDLDLDIPNQAIAKVVKHDLPAIDGLVWTMPVESLRGSALAVSVYTAPHPNPPYVLPQLRAPPR